jgi:hypothetical protein
VVHFIWRCDETKQFGPFGEKLGAEVVGAQPDFCGDFAHVTPPKRRGFKIL